MKSYFLEGLTDKRQVQAALSRRLPHWVEPWLFKDDAGDVIAYVAIETTSDGDVSIQADLSGRHHDDTDKVVALLRDLQATLGGRVMDDDENVL